VRRTLERLRESLHGALESFELLDGTRYYYGRLATHKVMFVYALDAQLGRAGDWHEPPEIYRKLLEARDPAAVLEKLGEAYPQGALVNVAEIFDVDALVNERRLELLPVEPVEDLSES
jgi:hypothetical protein